MSSSHAAVDTVLSHLKDVQTFIRENSELLKRTEDSAIRQQASALAHKLWLELEEPGYLIDRIMFQVCIPEIDITTTNLQLN